jgi:hypothetical protein
LIAQARTRPPKKRGADQGSSTPKIYSWHAPEVACISKGKARTPYEFGAKVSIATSIKGNLIVGARAFGANPFDGHTSDSHGVVCGGLQHPLAAEDDCKERPRPFFCGWYLQCSVSRSG